MEPEKLKNLPPQDLYKQIEELYSSFIELQKAAAGIANTKVPDASAHLQDVLKSTEEATHTILDCATAIEGIGSGLADETAKNELSNHVTRIYEACNFQDITGQRIKKVLKSLSALEENVKGLISTAKIEGIVQDEPVDEMASLLNGPQLSGAAPTQDDIDKLFSAS